MCVIKIPFVYKSKLSNLKPRAKRVLGQKKILSDKTYFQIAEQVSYLNLLNRFLQVMRQKVEIFV